MNNELLKRAKEKVSSDSVLINLISKRVRELINGAKPLVRPKNLDEDKCDIALREVAEGKLIAQIDFDAIQRMDDAKKAWMDKSVNTNMYFAD
jgi:DNA-directed RNA polymerase subunit K/omega